MNQKMKFVLIALGFFVAGVIVSGMIRNQIVENMGATALYGDEASQTLDSISTTTTDNTNINLNKSSYTYHYIKRIPAGWELEFCSTTKKLPDDEGGMTNDCPTWVDSAGQPTVLDVIYYSGGGAGASGESVTYYHSLDRAGYGGGAGQGGKFVNFQYRVPSPASLVTGISGVVGAGQPANSLVWSSPSTFYVDQKKIGGHTLLVSVPGVPQSGSNFVNSPFNYTAVLPPLHSGFLPPYALGQVSPSTLGLNQGAVGASGDGPTSPGGYGSTIIKFLGIKTKVKVCLGSFSPCVPPMSPQIRIPPKANGFNYIDCFGGEGGAPAPQAHAMGGHGGHGGDYLWSDALSGNPFTLTKCVHKMDSHLNDGMSGGQDGYLEIGWN